MAFRLRNSICWNAGLCHLSRLADFLHRNRLFLLLRRFDRFRISLPAPKTNQMQWVRCLMSTSNMSITRRVQRICLTCTRQKVKMKCNLPLFVDRPPRDPLWMSRRPSAPRSRQSLVVTTPSLLLLTYLDMILKKYSCLKNKKKIVKDMLQRIKDFLLVVNIGHCVPPSKTRKDKRLN